MIALSCFSRSQGINSFEPCKIMYDLFRMARGIVSWIPYKVLYSSSTQQID